MSDKKSHGGKRTGSGAKPKYEEATETIAFRCPKSHVKPLKQMVKDYLDKLKLPPK